MKKLNRKIKVFVLDDDRYYGLFLKNALKNDNYDIHYFQHEQECIQHLKTQPDILILDHMLEYTTGLEILAEVNRQRKGKTQVIYLSAQEHVHIAIKALKEGAIVYVEKSGEAVKAIKQSISQVVKLTNNFNENLDFKAGVIPKRYQGAFC